MAFTEKIGTLTKTSSTQVQLAGTSIVKLGGQQRSLVSPTLLTSVSGIGGLDTGVVAASSFYYVYAVYNGSTTGLIASQSAVSPSGFTRYKKVGAFLTDSSSFVGKSYFFGEMATPKNYKITFSGQQAPAFTSGIITSHTPVVIEAPFLTPTAAGNPAAKFPEGYYGKRTLTVYGYCRSFPGSSSFCALSLTSTTPAILQDLCLWNHQQSATTGEYGGQTNILYLEEGYYAAQEYPTYGAFTTTANNVANIAAIECLETFAIQPDWN
jgi:hypothetical protein